MKLRNHVLACGWRIPKIMQRSASDKGRDSASATGMKRSLSVMPVRHPVLAVCLPTRHARDGHCTSPRRKTHISESRIVHYPWHPWSGRCVFIDERLDKNSLVVFRCHVEETQQWSALEIPEWMFDAGCNRMLLVDKPLVTCEAVSKLKVLLAGASNDDPIVKEAQRFEGGVDASETKFKTTPQLELFHPSIQIPRWIAIPSEVKRKTIRLLSRLLRQQWQSQRGLQNKEACGE